MPIGPVTNSHSEISVTAPVGPALERVKQMLFRPFDLGKWFTIGFCAWLAGLGEAGGGGGGGINNNVNVGNNNSNHVQEDLHRFVAQAHDYLLNNLYWIVPVAAFVIVFGIGLWILMLWLNCRGKFMFLHNVALDKAEIAVPWTKFESLANSLFGFRIVVALASFVVILPPLAVAAVFVLRMIWNGAPNFPAIMLCVGMAMLMVIFIIAFALVHKFTADFVVPVMFLRGQRCLAAWKEFWPMLSGNIGKFTLYILFQIVLGMAIGIIVLFAIVITCCLAGCLMIIPYIGTVVLLPVLVFKRAYSLYFFRQFGAAYDVFPSEAPPAPPAGLQPLPGAPV